MIGSGQNRAMRQSAQVTDVATQYLAYIAVIGMAAAVAVAAMTFSAQTALHLVDAAAFPNRAQHQVRDLKPTQPVDQDRASTNNTFAMLPSAMPIKLQNDVISSNF